MLMGDKVEFFYYETYIMLAHVVPTDSLSFPNNNTSVLWTVINMNKTINDI